MNYIISSLECAAALDAAETGMLMEVEKSRVKAFQMWI